MTTIFEAGHKRDAGSVAGVLRGYHDGLARGKVTVPCGDCNACCRAAPLTESEARAFGGEWYEGGWVMPSGADGYCVKLVDGACTVYAQRPQSCRLHDCRIVALFKIVTDDIDAEALAVLRSWIFNIETEDDYNAVAAIRQIIAKTDTVGARFAAAKKLAARVVAGQPCP